MALCYRSYHEGGVVPVRRDPAVHPDRLGGETLKRATGYSAREIENLKAEMGWRGTMNPTLIMLCGPSCAGKSTVAPILRDLFQAAVLNTDDIILQEAARRGTTYAAIFAEYFKTASGIYNAQLREALKADDNIVIDRTHVTRESRGRVLDRIPARYTKIAIAVGGHLSYLDLLSRRDRRVADGGVHVPDDVIERMHSAFTDEPPKTYEGFDLVLEYNDVAG